ncbi:hypothetical protein Cgig2_025996 [Carnegiea gigantea]|uniref:Uncharacterized protein n=1 Tax=Carnegiea gigantea TaxID=171969 RepID=A0A9Q1JJW3_9CARY|nr:hypothetical protein Cgig2_025996 [Carnegiea gigantea]
MADSPPWMKSEAPLPPSVESMIETICKEQSQPPPGSSARKELQSLGEEQSLEILNVIRGRKIVKTFHGFILYLARQRKAQGEITTAVTEAVVADGANGSQRLSPQFLALEGLEFRRLFLILSYIGRNKLEDVASLEEIQSLRTRSERVPMGLYESFIWNQFGQRFVEKTDRLKTSESSSGMAKNEISSIGGCLLLLPLSGWLPASSVLVDIALTGSSATGEFSGDRKCVGNMRRGCKKFVAIESKSFDLSVVGTKEDILKISENGRGISSLKSKCLVLVLHSQSPALEPCCSSFSLDTVVRRLLLPFSVVGVRRSLAGGEAAPFLSPSSCLVEVSFSRSSSALLQFLFFYFGSSSNFVLIC